MRNTDWLDHLTVEYGSVRAVALRAGIEPSTLSRQRGRGKISAGNVIAIARAHALNPVLALVASGYLTSDDLRETALGDTLHTASNEDLVAEVRRRMQGRRPDKADDDPTVPPPLRLEDASPDE